MIDLTLPQTLHDILHAPCHAEAFFLPVQHLDQISVTGREHFRGGRILLDHVHRCMVVEMDSGLYQVKRTHVMRRENSVLLSTSICFPWYSIPSDNYFLYHRVSRFFSHAHINDHPIHIAQDRASMIRGFPLIHATEGLHVAKILVLTRVSAQRRRIRRNGMVTTFLTAHGQIRTIA